MAVKIGHAVGDENGGGYNGQAGDQTGREIRTQNWYNRTGGWDVYLECTDADLANRAATLMEQICASPAFGYDKSDRWTGYAAIKANGGKVDGAADSEFDCSSLCISCYVLAGLNHKASGYTGGMEKSLLATGKFKAYRDAAHTQSASLAKRGGLYLTAGAHVAMTLTNGEEATSSEAVAKPYLEILAKGVNVRCGGSTEHGSRFVAKRGQRFPCIGTDPETGWYRIVAQGKTAYISNKAGLAKLVE